MLKIATRLQHAWQSTFLALYCILYTVYCILFTVNCIPYTVYCILYSVRLLHHITLHITSHYTRTEYCTLYTTHCQLYTLLTGDAFMCSAARVPWEGEQSALLPKQRKRSLDYVLTFHVLERKSCIRETLNYSIDMCG